MPEIAGPARQIVEHLRALDAGSETSSLFYSPFRTDKGNGINAWVENEASYVEATQVRIQQNLQQIEQYSLMALGFEESDKELLFAEVPWCLEDICPSNKNVARLEVLVSYALGCVFGRWDIRCAYSAPLSTENNDLFDPLPNPSSGALKDGIAQLSYDYPIRVTYEGIIVDDPGHPDDIEDRINAVLQLLWPTSRDRTANEITEFLNSSSPSLNAWIRQSLFNYHISIYSGSRRKAPIYWQLGTPSVSYSVWLYYHRFTKDTFYNVLNDYVTPKLQHEERKLTSLVQTAGPNPTASQRKEIAEQEAFVEELRIFREEVARIAPLWNPDFNDGVIINFAPLWRLVPHHRAWQKECKDCWDKLVAGDYDWSHLAMHLWPERVVPKCAKDRSLAIAHGLEDVFWIEGSDGKWQPKKVDKAVVDTLIAERTSPAVKEALHNLLHAPAPTSSRGRGPRQAARRAGLQRSVVTSAVTRANGDSTAGTPEIDPALLDAVKQAIASAADGASKPEILAATGLTNSQWNAAINALLTQGVVTKTGERRGPAITLLRWEGRPDACLPCVPLPTTQRHAHKALRGGLLRPTT